jgi:hypothetical protein
MQYYQRKMKMYAAACSAQFNGRDNKTTLTSLQVADVMDEFSHPNKDIKRDDMKTRRKRVKPNNSDDIDDGRLLPKQKH